MIIKQLLAFLLSFTLVFISIPSFAAFDPNSPKTKWYMDRLTAEKNTTNFGKVDIKVDASKTYPVSTLGPDGKPIKQQRTAKSTTSSPHR